MLISILEDLLQLIYPNLCQACTRNLKKNENTICLYCQMELPVTDFHQYAENKIAKQFYGRVKIEAATCLLYFQKHDIVQTLIHKLKYKGKKNVGVYLGKWLGSLIREEELFQGLTMIIPVPLHWKKQKQRGYNQSELFAEGIALILDIPCEKDILIRPVKGSTQTNKNRLERWLNASKLYELKNRAKLKNQHVLLVDDVATTGATLEVCAQKLLEVDNVKVSIATIAWTES